MCESDKKWFTQIRSKLFYSLLILFSLIIWKYFQVNLYFMLLKTHKNSEIIFEKYT